jgi:hypothetical protein
VWTSNEYRSLCSAVLWSSVSKQQDRLLESAVFSCVLSRPETVLLEESPVKHME